MESKSKRIKVREIYKFFDNIGNVEELEIEGKNIISSFNDYEKFEIYNNSTNIINKNIKVKYELNKKDIKKIYRFSTNKNFAMSRLGKICEKYKHRHKF